MERCLLLSCVLGREVSRNLPNGTQTEKQAPKQVLTTPCTIQNYRYTLELLVLGEKLHCSLILSGNGVVEGMSKSLQSKGCGAVKGTLKSNTGSLFLVAATRLDCCMKNTQILGILWLSLQKLLVHSQPRYALTLIMFLQHSLFIYFIVDFTPTTYTVTVIWPGYRTGCGRGPASACTLNVWDLPT